VKIDNLEFVDFPHQVSIREYDRNEREFVNYFQHHSAVAAIYKIGGMSDPGISDLDLILVLRENQFLEHRDHEFLDMVDDYIFAHQPFVIPETLFPDIHYSFYPSNLRSLAGEGYTFTRLASNTEQSQLAWLICAEAAVGRLSDIVYQLTCKSSISIRRMLLKLNSIKHNINLLQNVDETIVDSESYGFVDRITELRTSWFLLHKEEQIKRTREIMSRGIAVLLNIINSLALVPTLTSKTSFCSQKHLEGHYLLPNCLQIVKFDSIEKAGIITYANPLSFLKKISGSYKHRITRHVNDFSIITIPRQLVLLFQPSFYGVFDGDERFERNLIIHGKEVPLEWGQECSSELIRSRSKFFGKYNEFIRDKGLSSMSFLSMASWHTNTKARFYNGKKAILKGILRLQIV